MCRITGLDTFVVIGDSGTQTIAPGGGTQTFLPNTGPIPAQVGDVIGTYAVTALNNCERQADSRGERQARQLRAPKVGDPVVPVTTVGWDVNVAANFIQAAPGATTSTLTDSASPNDGAAKLDDGESHGEGVGSGPGCGHCRLAGENRALLLFPWVK